MHMLIRDQSIIALHIISQTELFGCHLPDCNWFLVHLHLFAALIHLDNIFTVNELQNLRYK